MKWLALAVFVHLRGLNYKVPVFGSMSAVWSGLHSVSRESIWDSLSPKLMLEMLERFSLWNDDPSSLQVFLLLDLFVSFSMFLRTKSYTTSFVSMHLRHRVVGEQSSSSPPQKAMRHFQQALWVSPSIRRLCEHLGTASRISGATGTPATRTLSEFCWDRPG